MPLGDTVARHFSEYESGNARVIAGPGTGKTTHLVSHVSNLLAQGLDAERTLILTFSRATAADLREKLDDELPEGQRRPLASTLHSYCFRELRRETGSTFVGETTVDEWEARNLVCEDLGGLLGVTGAQAHELLLKYDAAWRTLGDAPTEAVAANFEANLEALRRVFDFALLGETVYKFKRFLDGAPGFHPEIDVLFVDEYQDLNPCDLYVIRALAHRSGADIVALGDDDQCIYAFRHADPDGIARFPDEHEAVEPYELNICFRCPSNIYRPAARLIAHNDGRLSKTTTPHEEGGLAAVHAVYSEKQQREAVVELVDRHVAEGVAPKEILVLVPRRNLAETYTGDLVEAGFNVVNLAAPDSALNELEVRRLIYALELAHRPDNAMAMRGWLHCSHGVGVKTVAALLQQPEAEDDFRQVCEDSDVANLKKATESLSEAIDSARDPDRLAAWIAALRDDFDLTPETTATLQRLATRLHESWGEVDEEGEPAVEEAQTEALAEMEEGGRIRVLTMRKAKGLGADVVIIPDAEQPLIPGNYDIAEQRRLFYVSVTRAQRALHVLHVAAPRRSGRTRYAGSGHRRPDAYRQRTQFLDEMNIASQDFQ